MSNENKNGNFNLHQPSPETTKDVAQLTRNIDELIDSHPDSILRYSDTADKGESHTDESMLIRNKQAKFILRKVVIGQPGDYTTEHTIEWLNTELQSRDDNRTVKTIQLEVSDRGAYLHVKYADELSDNSLEEVLDVSQIREVNDLIVGAEPLSFEDYSAEINRLVIGDNLEHEYKLNAQADKRSRLGKFTRKQI